MTTDADLRAARERLPIEVFDYIAGGAGDEVTARDNERAFDRVHLRPRVLRDVSVVDTTTSSLDGEIAYPLMFAPTAFHQLVDDDGEVATASAAAAANVPMVVSTMSNVSMEVVAERSGHQHLWLQLYYFKDRDLTASLVRRAEAAGYRAIMVTVGIPYGGDRQGAGRTEFRFPDALVAGNLAGAIDGLTVPEFVEAQVDPSVTWDDLAWLRSLTDLPVYLKGILHAADAEQACQLDVAGIVVSNHGGRQLDTSVPTIRALPDIAEVVDGRVDILLDSGVRTGGDIFKACALGASAVMIGRPVLWALAAGGRRALEMMTEELRKDFELTMALAGCCSVSEVGENGRHLTVER